MQKIFVTTLGPPYSRAAVSLVNDQSKKDMGFVGFLTITNFIGSYYIFNK